MKDEHQEERERNFDRSTLERGGHMVALTKQDVPIRWCDGEVEGGEPMGVLHCQDCQGFAAETGVVAIRRFHRDRLHALESWLDPE